MHGRKKKEFRTKAALTVASNDRFALLMHINHWSKDFLDSGEKHARRNNANIYAWK
jgi:hypothetical protein